MALRSVISSRIPLVIILGATGTGKTKLSVELAQKFGTEVISADSMQIYKGLDVVTAKASRQERELVRHHLLDILDPDDIFTVVDFRDRSLDIIEKLTKQGKTPIVVGGTNYYIESVVYKILVEKSEDVKTLLWDRSRRKRDFDDNEKSDGHAPKKAMMNTDEANSIASKSDETKEENLEVKEITKEQLQADINNEKIFSNAEIHAKLAAIDPVMAKRHHPNNRRKVLRSIEVWLKTGRRHSEVLDDQKLSEGQLRRPDATIMLWLKCDQKVHDERLNSRVDSMLEEGLIEELLDFHARHNAQRIKDGELPDYTKGIFQTLGLKEFHEYLMLPEDQKTTDEGRKLLQESIDNMKMATRRFARRQNKMVKGRFLEHRNREVPLIYELDTTDISKWDEEVKNKAIHIIESYMNGSTCKYDPLKPAIDDEKRKLDSVSHNYCEVCERIILGDKEYAIHLKSNRHMKVSKKKNKLEKQNVVNQDIE